VPVNIIMSMSGCQALEEWCRLVLNTYPGVSISNMSSSWSDGKAFCALIHSHRPDLIDWDVVKVNTAQQNCHLAFQTAEQRLGITSLLDVCDVARGARRGRDPPDRLSILTYVSQFYHKFQSVCPPDSGISSPSHDTTADKSRRGDNVHSLLSSRRSRSVSASPPMEKENPFRREFLENISSKAEKSPCKKLVNKFHKQKTGNSSHVGETEHPPSVRLRHQNKENENKTRRLVQSMFVEPLQDKRMQPVKSSSVEENKDEKPIKSLRMSRSSQGLLSTPKPYRTAVHQEPQQSVSILSKTQNYLHEKRKRSQSQPPVADKKEKRKFDFLSTANFNPILRESSKKIDMEKQCPENKADSSALKLNPQQKCLPRKNEKSVVMSGKKDDKHSSSTTTIKTPQFCNFKKFEFALQSHRRFVQTLV